MRIDKLKLTRYGHFTDFEFDFGAPPASGAADLHVLYGPNEAGKSTTLAAITDLLHGMPRKTGWSFLHNNELLLVEAVLRQSGRCITLQRFKNHIADETGERLEAFPLDLQGLTREEYARRFSFDEQTLRDGGEQILQSEGDIGQALFSASAGLSDLKARIDAAMIPANAFWMPKRTRNIRLKELKDALQSNRKQMTVAKLDISTWKARHKALADTEQLRTNARRQKNKLSEAINALETRKSSQRVARNLLHQLKRRDAIISQGIVSDEAARTRGLKTAEGVRKELESVRELISTKQQIDTKRQSEEARIASLAAERDQLTTDELNKAIFAARDQIISLQESASAEVEWRLQLAEHDEVIAQCDASLKESLHRLGLDSDADLSARLPGEHVIDEVALLIDQGKDLRAKLAHASEEIDSLQLSQPEVLDASHPVADTSVATDVLKRVQREALFQTLKTTISDRLDVYQAIKTQAHELSLGEPSTSMPMLPDESWLATALTGLGEVRSELSHLENEISELKQQIATNQGQCDLLSASGFVAESQLQESRRTRDEAWNAHRKLLLEESSIANLTTSANTFEQLLHQHDDREAALRNSIEQSTQYSLLITRIQQDKLTLMGLEQKALKKQDAISSLQKDIHARVKDFHKDEDIDVDGLRTLFNRVSKLRDTQTQWHKLDATVEQLQLQCQQQCAELLAVIQDFIPAERFAKLQNLSLQDLLQQIEQSINEQNTKAAELNEAARLRQNHEQTMARRLADRQAVEESMEQWKQQWHATTSNSLFHGLSLAQAADAIGLARLLGNTVARKADASAAHRVLSLKMTTRQEAVSSLLRQLNHPSLATLVESLAAAVQQETERSGVERQIKEARKALDQIDFNANSNSRELSSLCAVYGVKNVDDVLTLLDVTAELRLIEQRCDDESMRLQEITGKVVPEDELATLVSENPDEELDAQLLDLKSQLQEADDLYDEYNRQWAIDNTALNAIGDGNEYATLAQERANLLLEIEEGALATAKARCGQIVLRAAIARFRQEHQSTLLANARQAFTTLTAGRYINLIPHDDGKGHEQLMATDSDNRSRAVHELSTGTRYQLYLALRAAAYAEYARLRTPLPFVADDIMESFDDERSAAAFRVLGQMATHGQVLYMTHHQHLLDIARDVLGEDSVRVHYYGEDTDSAQRVSA